jgi:hypothetical protein
MAVKWPLATGNWSNAANWNDGTKPTTGDVVHADGKTVTIDEDFNLGAGSKLTTETRSGGTAGGGFTFSTDRTLTVAEIVSNVSSACLTYTGAGTATVNANGTATLNNANCIAINHTGAGTLTVNGAGNATGGLAKAFQNSAAGAMILVGNMVGFGTVVVNNSTGSLTLTGDATTSASNNLSAVLNNSTGTVTITGNPSTTGSTTGDGARNVSTGTMNITGNPSTTSSGNGARNNSAGTMTVTTVGTLAGTGLTAVTGFAVNNASAGNLTVTGNVAGSAVNWRPTVYNAGGFVQISGSVASGAANRGLFAGPALRNEANSTRAQIGSLLDVFAVEGGFYAATYPATTEMTIELESATGDTITLYAPDAFPVAWSPLPANVRFEVIYQNGALEGTCHVPPAESVALNVPVDDTVGTYVGGGGGASAEDIYAYFTADSRADAFKADVSGLATATAVSAIPTNPLLTTDARLNNLNATIGSRLASVDYTAPANSDIAAIRAKTDTLENAPTTAAIRTALEDPPLPANIEQVRGQDLTGTGAKKDPWNPAE